MTTRSMPPLLLGVTLLFWGWQSGFLIVSIVMAIVVEAARLINSRWEFAEHHLYRAADLCAVLLLITAVYFFITSPARSITKLTACLPIVLFPLFAVQHYNISPTIDLKVLILSLRRKYPNQPTRKIRPAYPYFLICMMASGAANNRTPLFFIGMLLICAWALWPLKPRYTSRTIWLLLFLGSGLIGFAGHVGLNKTQKNLMDWSTDWYYNLIYKDRNPLKTKTAMGDIGSLKPSSKILFRVQFKNNSSPPLLLNDACYNIYGSTYWSALPRQFKRLQPASVPTTWHLAPPPALKSQISVFSYLEDGKGLLKLPNGSFQIDHLPATKLEQNALGTVSVTGGPDIATYDVRFSQAAISSGAISEYDLNVPKKETETINRIAQNLKLATMTPSQVLSRLDLFFQKQFTYSLNLEGQSDTDQTTALTYFLTHSRSGHCEFFATATVLLLRAAGIPARYATGFSVHEKARYGGLYIVRERHAHAWALAHINDVWINVDNTPPAWIKIEDRKAAFWEPILDLFSFLHFKFSEWYNQAGRNQVIGILAILAAPVILILVKKRSRRTAIKRRRRIKSDIDILKIETAPVTEFSRIENKLNQFVPPREAWEPLGCWIDRVKDNLPPAMPKDLLKATLTLYYRQRFDPQGLAPDETRKLKTGIKALAG